jgi:hypothetical protein
MAAPQPRSASARLDAAFGTVARFAVGQLKTPDGFAGLVLFDIVAATDEAARAGLDHVHQHPRYVCWDGPVRGRPAHR